MGKMPMECSSLLLLMERLYALQMLCFTNDINFCVLVEHKQQEHFKAYLKAYNVRNVKPKHHYSLHVPGQWRKTKTVPNTLAMERKHQGAKREVESSMQNLEHFECRLLRQLQCVQSTEISKKGPNYWLTELLDPEKISDGRWTAKQLRRPSGLWKISTPMLSPDLQYAGWIDNFVQIQDEIYISFKMFRSSKVIGLGVYEWENSHETRLGTLSVSCFWKLVGNKSLLTIWWFCRSKNVSKRVCKSIAAKAMVRKETACKGFFPKGNSLNSLWSERTKLEKAIVRKGHSLQRRWPARDATCKAWTFMTRTKPAKAMIRKEAKPCKTDGTTGAACQGNGPQGRSVPKISRKGHNQKWKFTKVFL